MAQSPGHRVPARAPGADGRAPRHRGRRRLPPRARPQGEPRRSARRQRAARHFRLRAPAGRLRGPGVARGRHRAPHRHPGRAPPHGPARARQAPAPGSGPGGGCARVRRRRRAHAGRLDRGPPDRLGERRRVAPAPPLGPDPAAEAALSPRRDRPRHASRAGGPRPRHGRDRRRNRPDTARSGVVRRVAPVAPCGHRGGAGPGDRQGLAAPARRPHAPAGRALAGHRPCGACHPSRPRPSGDRQDGVARPARPPGAAHSRVGGRAQQAPAQRLPHLHGGPAPPGGRRAGGRAHRHCRATGPPPGRHPPARHRQGLPRRPHRGRHGSG